MDVKKQKRKKRESLRKQILQRKENEIRFLKEKILKLQEECRKKDELINSVNDTKKELEAHIESLKKKGDEYDALNEDLMQMRKVFNQTIFKGRWKIIKWLMK